jgi:hypothetical protein
MSVTMEPLTDVYGAARLAATEYRMVDGVRQKLMQQFGAWERFGIPIPDTLQAWFDAECRALEAMKAACLRSVVGAWKETQIAEYADATIGIGPALLLILSLAPELDRFPNPAKLWRYLGLHRPGHPPAGKEDRAYSAQLKAWCLFRLAEPCVKNRESPFRAVYDRRREGRPDMLPEGECPTCDAAYAKRKATGKAGWDCHNMGGPHYKAAHARVDALRVTAKAILLDAWRIAHGFEPRVGGHSRNGAHTSTAPEEA